VAINLKFHADPAVENMMDDVGVQPDDKVNDDLEVVTQEDVPMSEETK
jgi:hypothetical protein